MAEVYPGASWDYVTGFYLCLSLIWTLVESKGGHGCGMKFSGSTYMGTRNMTITGKVCQAWTSNHPHHIADDIEDDQFPDDSIALAHNFCRNPQPKKKSGVWCYTMDPKVEWEYCDPCPENYGNYRGCTLNDKGASYTGTLDHSRSHSLCQPWLDYENEDFVFRDGSDKKAKNYCRNPLPGTYLAPWCYTKAFGVDRWDYCDICKPFTGDVKLSVGHHSTGFQMTLNMDGQSCISWCITYLSCVGVVVSHNGGKKCFYHTSLRGNRTSNDSFDQYEISRDCKPPKKCVYRI